MKYPFLNLKDVNTEYAEYLREAANRVINSGWYLNGSENRALEQELATVCKTDYAVTVSNGLDALRLIFRAYIELGMLHEGDEVIVQANTYIASILAIDDCKLKPVLVEPTESTFNLDSDLAERAVTERTKAILVVHLYGTPCWDSKLKELSQKYGLLIVEDNAQAIGAWADTTGLNGGYITGSLGHAAAHSFYPTKNIGALGDAGAVTTCNKSLASTIRALANYGSDRRYHNIYRGYNCRMDEIQAAFLREKLHRLDNECAKRQQRACAYDRSISNPLITKPIIHKKMQQVWHQYVVRCKERERLREYLTDNGVGTDIHYATPPHLQPCYSSVFTGSYPLTERLADEMLSLPIASVNSNDIIEISRIINEFK